jgi:hypothetical protein
MALHFPAIPFFIIFLWDWSLFCLFFYHPPIHSVQSCTTAGSKSMGNSLENANLTAPDQLYRFSAVHALELEAWQKLFYLQTAATQEFLEKQAGWLAWAMMNDLPQVRFGLPERVACEVDRSGQVRYEMIPENHRQHQLVNRWRRLTHTALRPAVQQRFTELEGCPDNAVVLGAGLLRFACSMYMVRHMVHSWWSEDCLPDSERSLSAFVSGEKEFRTFSRETVAHFFYADADQKDAPGGQELKPAVGSHRLSGSQEQTVIDVCQPVLVEAVNEAERLMAAMQQYLTILDMAVALAPYVVADADFQHKRFRIVGQLIQQGRALAQFRVREIVQSIQLRAASNLLNRGLSLSLPYFDDHALEMRCWKFQVIPAGRTPFSPAFVVRAVWLEQEKLSRDPCLSPSTRKHLLVELNSLERAFDGAAGY